MTPSSDAVRADHSSEYSAKINSQYDIGDPVRQFAHSLFGPRPKHDLQTNRPNVNDSQATQPEGSDSQAKQPDVVGELCGMYVPKSRLLETPSAEARERAKKTLSADINPLVDPDSNEKLSKLQSSLIDGDLNRFSDAVQSFKGDPGKLEKFITEMQKNLSGANADVHVSAKDGVVTVYRDNASCAIDMNSSDGKSTLRPITTTADGIVIKGDGEVMNRDAASEMRDISNVATNGINGPCGMDATVSPPAYEGPHNPHQPIPLVPYSPRPGLSFPDDLRSHRKPEPPDLGLIPGRGPDFAPMIVRPQDIPPDEPSSGRKPLMPTPMTISPDMVKKLEEDR